VKFIAQPAPAGTGTSPNFTSPSNGTTRVRFVGGSIVDNTTAVFMASPGSDQSNNIFSTVLISNSPFLTYIAGNATFVTCTVVTGVHVLGYQSSTFGSSNAN
jgi:hypothetical protein